MKRFAPLYVSEANAASLLDLKVEEFRRLVSEGHLPCSRTIAPGFHRWPVDDLRAIIDGTLGDGMGNIEW